MPVRKVSFSTVPELIYIYITCLDEVLLPFLDCQTIYGFCSYSDNFGEDKTKSCLKVLSGPGTHCHAQAKFIRPDR